MNNETHADAQAFNLASILNILWRRRLIVVGLPLLGLAVGLLYGIFGTRRWEATATVRPGITAFAPDGGPYRHWQLKDITRWYEQGLYTRDLVACLDLAPGARPVVRAEFIAQGLQNLQGGDIITLWTTATSPELAAAILDSSMVLFERYAVADTVGSPIKLTRDGLRLQVERLRIQLSGLAKKDASIELALEQARAESLTVLAEDQRLGLDADKIRQHEVYYERRLADLAESEPRLAADLIQLDHTRRRLALGGEQDLAAEDLPSWVKRNAILDSGDVLQSLSAASMEVRRALEKNRSTQDSLAYRLDVARIERSQLEIKRETEIRAKMRESGRTLGELRLERQYDLPHERLDFQNQIQEREVKLGTISPLQRVGRTVVSDKPVRPRKVRAMIILVFLGAVGGVVLAFVGDYLLEHRREIFRS